jgi:hypothetical protein
MAQEIGPWTDLYSTGVVAYELLLGRLPFEEGDTPVAVLMQVVNEPIPPPREVDPSLDPALAAWVERMLAKEPAGRPPDAATAWEELEEITIGLLGPRWRREARLVGPARGNGGPRLATTKPREAERPTRAAAAPPTVARRSGRRRGLLVIGALVLLAAAGLALAILLGRSDEPTTLESTGITTRTAPTTRAARTTTQAQTTTAPLQRAGAVVEDVAFARSGPEVTARVAFEGAAPKAAGLRVPDGEIADGSATFVLWQQGVGHRIGRRTAEGVTVAVTGKPSRLVFELAAAPGAFVAMSEPRVVGKAVEVTLTEPAPAVTTTTPRDTTPAPPTQPQPTVSIG